MTTKMNLTKATMLMAIAASVAATAIAGGEGSATRPAPAEGEAPTAIQVPQSLRPPAGQVAFLEALATGVQIYECAAKPDQPSTYEWAFRAPEAVLSDRSGRALGKHYAGPTWESPDGTAVVGEVTARDPGPDKTAIPWLLMSAKSVSGEGGFAATQTIQRVSTVGGLPPAEPCTAANASQVARVPYTATYYFYRAAR
jgi:hypothetical protein